MNENTNSENPVENDTDKNCEGQTANQPAGDDRAGGEAEGPEPIEGNAESGDTPAAPSGQDGEAEKDDG